MDDKIRVIVVEDDPDLCDTLVEFLILSGMDVTGVNSGLEFYRVVAKSSFTVAVLDVGLPDQSGYVLAEYVRRNYAMGVIILTAHGEAEERLKGYESGADVYMVKPIDCRELASAIKNLSLRISRINTDSSLAADDNFWRLNTKSWTLLSPNNESITLTAKEMQFIASLAKSSGEMTRRQHLLVELGYSDDEYANRAMDSLVRRLRRKIETATSVQPPIKTAYTGGYSFSAPIVIS